MNPLNHVAIIMDGNGRWGLKHRGSRNHGHKEGLNTVEKIINISIKQKIKHLTLYAFSMENWKRPKFEVDALMKLLINSLENELPNLMENDIKLCAIGDLVSLQSKSRKKLNEVMALTSKNKKLILTLAISYGSRQELTNAVEIISDKVKNNIISQENIDEKIINEHLYSRNLPDVDLLIRTGGEYRISNFLLWQIAYAELYFSDILWPDFRKDDFFNAIISYQKRERRFGKISEQK